MKIKKIIGLLPIFSFDDNSVSSSKKNNLSTVGKMTGVSRYLNEKALVTGVARYLTEKSMVTGVEKYLKTHQQNPATGVSKYMAQQILSNDESSGGTSVSKYIRKQIILNKDKPAFSSVSKYMAIKGLKTKEQQLPVESGVVRYLSNLDRQKKEDMPSTNLEKLLYEREKEAKQIAAAALIAEYVKKDAEAASKNKKKRKRKGNSAVAKKFDPKKTGVALYLAKQDFENDDSLTRVERYVAKQKRAARYARIKTGVEKYIAKQASNTKVKATGVTKYLLKQMLSEKIVIPTTGVEKYITRKNLTASKQVKKSSVTRYLTRLSILEKDKKKVKKPKAKLVALKNEENSEETGVERYLAKKAEKAGKALIVIEKTSVEKYLAVKAENKVQTPDSLTGVEKYLRGRA